MTERERCSALQTDSTCRNGFYVTGPCHGTDGTPICVQEEVCGRIYGANGGIPIVIKRALSKGETE